MLPEAFLLRMKRLLSSEEYCAYLTAAEAPPVRALRVNTLAISREGLLHASPFPLRAVDFLSDGFLFDSDRPGAHPLHHAGAYYVQDPSAQATLAALPDLPPTAKVLDLCAAPGGKSTAVAARLAGEGILVANELSPARAKVLVGNLERCGVVNAIVLNTDAREVAALYRDLFDLVLLDAPCSGEGMLRKYTVAVEEWSEENVRMCARRQRELLLAAADAVAPGGCLLYSTCTFSPEENEYAVAEFLALRPDFSIEEVPASLVAATRAGISLAELRSRGFFPLGELPTSALPLERTRRFYPHVAPGEGQYIARLRRAAGGVSPAFGYRDAAAEPPPAIRRIALDFLRETVEGLPSCRLSFDGNRLLLLPCGFPLPPRRVFSAGVLLGEVRKDRLLPHHHFFSAYGKCFKRTLALSSDDPAVYKYLRGEELPTSLPDGWGCVLIDGIPTGGIKVSGGRAKNHYPKGLRLP